MSVKVAFVGFRHGHVQAMYHTARRLDYVDIVACVDEEGPDAHGSSLPALGVELTHESFDQVLAEVDFEVLACVDYYARRGPTCLKALEAGKHVVTDKPLCTTLEDLRAIARLAREKDLQVGIDLTMRYGGDYATLAGIVQQGGIGELSSCLVTGLHTMSYGSRPMWYFEPGKHGGTINDLMIHGLDLLRWATGLEYSKVIFAEAWNRRAPVDFFQDSAQMALEFANRAKYLGDCSYMAPENCPEHWRFFLWGTEGSLAADANGLKWYRAGEGEQPITACNLPPITDPFEDFVSALGRGTPRWLSSEECFKSQAAALAAQLAADTGQRDMPVPTI
jgi:predicted dehydrogenase